MIVETSVPATREGYVQSRSMSLLRRLRRRAGALALDWPRFEATMRGLGPYRRLPSPWVAMRNRDERITLDTRGARCDWIYGSDLHIANVFPSAAVRLLRRALHDRPIELGDAPADAAPEVSFVIGHRGMDRLPQLLTTLRSIAGQRGAAVECVVVEQSPAPEIQTLLPPWVRYLHTPADRGSDYNRAWALNAGARVARGEVLVLHDNDMLCPASYAAEALARAREGWLFQQLKRFTFYLGETDTAEVFATGRLRTDVPTTVVQNVHGGSIAATRAAYFEIGGYDESFVGWGGEDNEFWDRAETTGRVYPFGYLPFVHLWHAPQPGKGMGGDAPAVRRWHELEDVPAEERIRRLRGV
jgi:hypothetical protein